MSPVLELAATDGRWLRSIRTRSAIIDAWLELIDEGDLSPTAKGVADRAGIGLRTVFQHFTDMNSLHLAGGQEMVARLLPTMTHVPADRPLSERIELVASSRGQIFEQMTLLRRACERQEWLSDDIHELINDWERVGQTSTMRIFEAELSLVADHNRDAFAVAVDSVLCWSNWNQLRQRRELTINQSQTVIQHTLEALLG